MRRNLSLHNQSNRIATILLGGISFFLFCFLSETTPLEWNTAFCYSESCLATYQSLHEILAENYLFSFLKSNSYFMTNFYFVLQFSFITASSFLALRSLGFHLSIAAVTSLLYAFLPYHTMHGIAHLTQADYSIVPWIIVCIIRSYQFSAYELFAKKWFLIPLVVGIVSLDYAIFTFVFMILPLFHRIHGLFGSMLKNSDFSNLFSSKTNAIAPIIIQAFLLIAIFARPLGEPNRVEESLASQEDARPSSLLQEKDLYSFKLSQLLAPVSSHRLEALALYKAQLNRRSLTPIAENDSISLGLWLSLGFVFLLLGGLTQVLREGLAERSFYLALWGLLYGYAAGTHAWAQKILHFPWHQPYRIGIFLAFFAVVGLAIICQKLRPLIPKVAFMCLLNIIIVSGLWDQTTPQIVLDLNSPIHSRP